ncbi:MAG: diguanylate cyclase [Acholeplasmataceae bacterium]|nr:diguanylate cyclase [Acholeplasmataceae bacterium]
MNTKIITFYLFVGVLFLSIMFVYSLYRGKSGFSKTLGFLSLSLEIYLFGYLMEINSSTLSEMMFWNQIQYFGIPFFPGLWLLVCLLYTGHAKGLWEWKFVLIFIIPVLTFILRLTNQYHHIYYSLVELKDIGGTTMLYLSKGLWYYVQMFYVLICLVLSTLYYGRRYINSNNEEKTQFRLFLLATLPPYVALVLGTIDITNIGIDYTALVLPLCVLIINIALTRYNFLEIKLMARERVFEESQNGLIILNKELEIMDYNQASTKYFNWMKITLKSDKLTNLFKDDDGIVTCVAQRKEGVFQFSVQGEERFISVAPKEISSKKGTVGILLIIEDVTARELTNRKLLVMARYDDLSGLFNRRCFLEEAQATIKRAKSKNEICSVLMMDIDNFKLINDKYGHSCGDRVIQVFSDMLRSIFRKIDIIGRVGGEEFSIVMLDYDATAAYDIAETFRKKVEAMVFDYNNQKIYTTVSVGIAVLDDQHQSFDDLIRCADYALYNSKQNGRNQTTIYKIQD